MIPSLHVPATMQQLEALKASCFFLLLSPENKQFLLGMKKVPGTLQQTSTCLFQKEAWLESTPHQGSQGTAPYTFLVPFSFSLSKCWLATAVRPPAQSWTSAFPLQFKHKGRASCLSNHSHSHSRGAGAVGSGGR